MDRSHGVVNARGGPLESVVLDALRKPEGGTAEKNREAAARAARGRSARCASCAAPRLPPLRALLVPSAPTPCTVPLTPQPTSTRGRGALHVSCLNLALPRQRRGHPWHLAGNLRRRLSRGIARARPKQRQCLLWRRRAGAACGVDTEGRGPGGWWLLRTQLHNSAATVIIHREGASRVGRAFCFES